MNFYVVLAGLLYCSGVTLGQYHAQYRSHELFSPQQSGPGEQPAPAQETARREPVAAAAPAPAPYGHVPATPIPAILSHKQSLTHDGEFNFAFSADNGLQQGESIQPDGTRTGGYSYVDPSGKTISVRYTAGKDGFKILQGDHIPGSADVNANQQQAQRETHAQQQLQQEQQLQPQPQPQQYLQQQIQYSGPQTFSQDNYQPATVDGAQFREAYERLQSYGPRYLLYKNTAPQANAIQQEQQYFDEPGKAHTFGNGYSFEFSG